MTHFEEPLHQHEFLPLCDVLFNIISLASYFCDVVFDLAMGYALANHPTAPAIFFPLSVGFVVVSLLISQIISMRWYLWGARGKLTIHVSSENQNSHKKKFKWTVWCVIVLHATQIGVLWRYFKLFIPVNLSFVKHEVRELCVLRLIHAFCEAAPMLLLQLYLLSIGIGNNVIKEGRTELESETWDASKLGELTAVSAGLSLWSVCWAVASFSKGAARLRNLERLVLTWLGVLAQLAWRLGTVSARVGALVAYASLYGGQWLLIVMALHWLSMLMWLLLTPDGLFHGGERLSFTRKTFLASLLAFVYIFAYVNLHETNHRQKMLIFYTVMFLENSLLIGVWAVGINEDHYRFTNQPKPVILILILIALFFGGLCFMALYYRFFHVRRLRYEAGGRMNGNSAATTLSSHGNNEEKRLDYYDTKKLSNSLSISMQKVKLSNNGIPGVFNCRFANPAVSNLNRKKKKPTTFVPPPPPPQALGDTKHWNNNKTNTKQLIPFWKRPLSTADNYDDEREKKTDVDRPMGSLNINLIREKLREKKQQQLRELRAIQEEIREGKLVPPPSASTSSPSSSISAAHQQPPPSAKLHTSPNTTCPVSSSSPLRDTGIPLTSWPPIKMHCLLPPPPSSSFHPVAHATNIWKDISQWERPDTSEILLAPRCLPLASGHHYPHWTSGHSQNEEDDSSKGEPEAGEDLSDMEGSQISLPKSHTLPREFKYNNEGSQPRERRAHVNKPYSSRFQPGNNSSDGDVDSADNDEETDSEVQGNVRNLHALNHEHDVQRRFAFANEEAVDHGNSVTNSVLTSMGTLGCYLNNSYGSRVNPLLKLKVKHETKL
ncbi:uncharacterized protein [Fopius arisanus]|uniref:XK-related protein n=1 Tax=Fopius arisanus TaxID=64838 RepID=A0A0C9Q6F0_9HYME|nr:PREDICTED: uncharacterized protein LOC105272366 [Fopius arisanus]XP_011312773.1 PREDICTED: uncharacterized protein LOC105272366 [Fopius arisanus]